MNKYLLLLSLFFFYVNPVISQIITVDAQWIANNETEGAIVFDQANTTYIFETDYTAEGIAVFVFEQNITIDLNGHTIYFNNADRNGTIGIYPCRDRSSSGLGSDDVNYSYTATSHMNAGKGLVVKNGRIINNGTQNGGEWATCIGAHYAGGGADTLKNLYLETTGKDGMNVFYYYSGFLIHDCFLVNYSNSTNNRHQLPAAIKTTSGAAKAYNNIIIGGLNGFHTGGGSEIFHNVIRQSGFATNGYSASFYRTTTPGKVYENIIIPTNGRGTLINADGPHEIYRNLILHLEKPNQEFGSALNPPAFRSRYECAANKYYDNTSLGIAGVTANDVTLTAASSIYLTNYAGYEKTYIYNNRCWVIRGSGTNTLIYANAITFEGHGSSPSNMTQDSIYNNDFRSNEFLVAMGGYDGSCYQDQIINNTFNWISGDSAYSWFSDSLDNFNKIRPNLAGNDYATQAVYDSVIAAAKNDISAMISGISDNPKSNRKTLRINFYGTDSYLSIFDSNLGSGTGLDVSDVDVASPNGTAEVKIGHSLWVVCKDSNNVTIANRPITVNDNTGLTFTGRSNHSGLARLQLIEYRLSKSSGSITISKNIHSGHNATIDQLGTVDLPVDVKNTKDNPLILNFPGALLGIPTEPSGLKITR